MKEWETVSTISIKYDTYSLKEFIDMVNRAVPEGTKGEDIRLDFDAQDSVAPYYDDVIIESTLTISIRK